MKIVKCLLIVLLYFHDVHAAPISVNIDLLSNNSAQISITGTLEGLSPPVGNSHILALVDPFDVGPMALQNDNVFVSSTLSNSNWSAVFAYIAGSGFNVFPDISSNFPGLYFGNIVNNLTSSNDVFSGILSVTLPSLFTFSPAGSTGIVTWGISGGSSIAGTWKISQPNASVPEPDSIFLIGLGLLSIIYVKRYRHWAKQSDYQI